MSSPGGGGWSGPASGPRAALRQLGASDAEIDQAESDGTLPLLSLDRLVDLAPARHDLAAVAARTGLAEDQIRHLWRSLGFTEPAPGEAVFSDADVEVLAQVGAFMADQVVSPDLLVQMSRVIGSSMARNASAQVDVLVARTGDAASSPGAGGHWPDDRVVSSLSTLLPFMPRVLEGTWRRHLHAAARRRMTLVGTGQGTARVVGFADLVGFTALSQQVTDAELAAVVDRFEALAFDVVTARDGRVVKMIGDEVMFTVAAPPAAAEIALALAEGTRASDDLSDVRVGLACGPVLEREGDLFGPVVNLASRITRIAFPGSIVVAESVRDALADLPGYELRSMRARHLKDIGRVPLWVVRRPADRRRRRE